MLNQFFFPTYKCWVYIIIFVFHVSKPKHKDFTWLSVVTQVASSRARIQTQEIWVCAKWLGERIQGEAVREELAILGKVVLKSPSEGEMFENLNKTRKPRGHLGEEKRF